MSRTINTMPIYVQFFEQNKDRCPSNFRETYDSQYGGYTWIDEDLVKIDWHRSGGVNRQVKPYRDIANRKFRARSRQAIREGRFDNMPKFVRTAQWDAW